MPEKLIYFAMPLFVLAFMSDKPIDPGDLKITAYFYLALAATIWVLRAAWRAVRRWRNA
jgi:hypothetical protein